MINPADLVVPLSAESGRSQVGVATEEAFLTSAALRNASLLLAPGNGRTLLVMSEVEIGIGRPDVLLLTASASALRSRANKGLRFGTYAEAQVLGSVLDGSRPAYTPGHVRTVTKRLEALGWLDWIRTTEVDKRVIADSLLIEAKVRDWRCGIVQLCRTRWLADSSALLFPIENQHLVPRKTLSHNRLGLLTADDNASLKWKINPKRKQRSLVADLWLTELAIRHLEQSSR